MEVPQELINDWVLHECVGGCISCNACTNMKCGECDEYICEDDFCIGLHIRNSHSYMIDEFFEKRRKP